MAIILYLENSVESINLDGIAQSGEGFQAISGLTGFGLPLLDVQWQEGAGNGATYRGHRTTPRDIDIPIHLYESTRADLKEAVDKLARIVDEPCTLRLVDGADTYRLNVIRVGGGDFVYGEDTWGEQEFSTIITFRAGQPFWEKTPETEIDLGNPNGGNGTAVTVTISQGGTAPMYPVYEITGPGIDFVAQDATTGRTIAFGGPVDPGETITIDTEACTVTNQYGDSRYDGLDKAPVFFPITKSKTDLKVSYDNTTSDYTAAFSGTPIYNEVINPTFDANATGWTGGTYDATNKRIKLDPHAARAVGVTAAVSTKHTVTGLTANTKYWFVANTTANSGVGGRKIYYRTSVKPLGVSAPTKYLGQVYDKVTPLTKNVCLPFTTPAGCTSVEIKVEAWLDGPNRDSLIALNEVFVGPPGYYFHGDWTDTATFTYAWTGTAHASRSSRTGTVPASNAGAGVVIKYKERDWVVI